MTKIIQKRLTLYHFRHPFSWYKFLRFFIFIFAFSASYAIARAPSEKSIVVIIPSYNNKDWYRFNLDSVLKQDYENFRILYLDDASTDETGPLVAQYLLENDTKRKVTLIQNQERVGALANIYRGVWMCEPHEIIVTVDGDDWLYHPRVLQILNDAYQDPNVWMTYGQYVSYPDGAGYGAQELPRWVVERSSYREYDWVTTHLRTFYAGLFQKIRKEDLLYEGKFFPVAADLAFMFPMLEMAGAHSRFIPEVLYVYNVETPLSDNKLYRDLQRRLETVIREKPPYAPTYAIYQK